jgi:uncharacterized protein with PIN domain
MTQIRFFSDEDVHGPLATHLRAAGFDAISTPEANRLGQSDLSQLQWSTREGRVLVTFDVSDFARLHSDWMNLQEHHAGLVVSKQRPIGDALRRLIHLGKTLGAEDMQDRLEYLSNW